MMCHSQDDHSLQNLESCMADEYSVMTSSQRELDAFRARKVALITGISGQVSFSFPIFIFVPELPLRSLKIGLDVITV